MQMGMLNIQESWEPAGSARMVPRQLSILARKRSHDEAQRYDQPACYWWSDPPERANRVDGPRRRCAQCPNRCDYDEPSSATENASYTSPGPAGERDEHSRETSTAHCEH
jgi:hypothetical protein